MARFFQFKKINLLIYLLLLLFFGMFIFLIYKQPCVDFLYHYRFSWLLKNDLSFFKNFDWQAYSLTSVYPADLYYGYHLLFIPFLIFNNPFFSIKLFSLFLIAFLFGTVYYAFYKLKLKRAGLWLILMVFGSSLFLNRLILTRPFLLSIAFSLLLLVFIIEKKYFPIWLTAFLWAFCYVGYPLAILMAALYLLINYCINRYFEWRLLLAVILGLAAGLMIRIDFPQNILLTFHQIFDSLYYKFIGLNLNISFENNSLSAGDLFQTSPLIVALIACQIFISYFLLGNVKQKNDLVKIYFFSALSFSFLFITMFDLRFIEYFLPFLIIQSAFNINLYNNIPKPEEFLILVDHLKFYFKKWFFRIPVIMAITCLFFLQVKNLYLAYEQSAPYDRYQITAEWLKNNTPADSIVFHTSWDNFSRLFFYNQHNRYLIGFDPTFIYAYDKNLYWLWRNITEKSIACTDPTNQIGLDDLTYSSCAAIQQTPAAIASAIKNHFHSEYIWINDYTIYRDFKKLLEANPDYFKKMIETDDSAVFKIIK